MERYVYDKNQPQGAMSLANMRATLRALHEMDLLPLRPRASFIMDDMEYSTDAAAAAVWSGTGVTVTKSTTVQKGSYAVQCAIDGTNNRTANQNIVLDISAYTLIKLWTRATTTSSAIQFYIQDGSGNESRWDITTSGSANTYAESSLTLASPSSNNGTNATLSNVAKIGFRLLDNGVTYLFDQIKAVAGMTVAIEGTESGSYYKNVYMADTIQPMAVSGKVSPTLVAPVTNPRIDILVIDTAGTLTWIAGTEASSPVPAWSSIPRHKMPICLVYCKTTMTKVLDYEDQSTDTNQGYIYADVRPFLKFSQTPRVGTAITAASTIAIPDSKETIFAITGSTTINNITATFNGHVITLRFSGACTVTANSGNIKMLNGNFTGAANGRLTLECDGTNWYEVARHETLVIPPSVPTGNISMWGTDTAPTGYLLCYGQAISRATYADLFAVIATTFGTGDGSTTFNLPDYRGRFPLGQDDMGGSSANRVTATEADNLGQASGAETHTLSTAEMPAHTHSYNASPKNSAASSGGNPNTTVTVTGDTTGSAGGGGAHNNMPPYQTINFIIKT